jgi:hypothetical protein
MADHRLIRTLIKRRLLPPRVVAANRMLTDLHEAGTSLLRLGNDSKLVLHRPTPTPFNPGDDLHPAACLRS